MCQTALQNCKSKNKHPFCRNRFVLCLLQTGNKGNGCDDIQKTEIVKHQWKLSKTENSNARRSCTSTKSDGRGVQTNTHLDQDSRSRPLASKSCALLTNLLGVARYRGVLNRTHKHSVLKGHLMQKLTFPLNELKDLPKSYHIGPFRKFTFCFAKIYTYMFSVLLQTHKPNHQHLPSRRRCNLFEVTVCRFFAEIKIYFQRCEHTRSINVAVFWFLSQYCYIVSRFKHVCKTSDPFLHPSVRQWHQRQNLHTSRTSKTVPHADL